MHAIQSAETDDAGTASTCSADDANSAAATSATSGSNADAIKLEILGSADEAARAASDAIARAIREHPATGTFTLALSGGHSPWLMLEELSRQSLPWQALRIFQVDERIAPAGDPDRNLTHLQQSLLARAPLAPDQVFAMPVEQPDLSAAADQYASTLMSIAGSPPALDLIHLGLGPDGHTASLVPGDASLSIRDRYVAVTGLYQGRRRMTLTYPALNAARSILWLVTGADKADALARLMRDDCSIPAGQVKKQHAHVIADRAAAKLVATTS